MEVILTLILFWVGYSVVVWIFRAAAGTTKAAVKSAVGRGSFSENMELEFKGIGPFQIRTVEKTIGEVKGIIIEGARSYSYLLPNPCWVCNLSFG